MGTCLSWEGNEQMKSVNANIRYAKCAPFLADWGFSGQGKMITPSPTEGPIEINGVNIFFSKCIRFVLPIFVKN